jgi:iron complex transport system substrate-binding protein
MRIVSLVPAATEMVCALGLERSLVGVSHECDYPESVRSLPKVTRSSVASEIPSAEIDALVRGSVQSSESLYTLDREMLVVLKPDLVVTQSLCNVCAVDEVEVQRALGSLDPASRIVRLSPTHLADVLEGLRAIGTAADAEERANEVIAELSARIDAVKHRSRAGQPRRVVMLEWIDPLFSAGHWNPELVEFAGGRECLGRAGERSRAVAWNEVIEIDPEVMVVACCGFTIQRTQKDLPVLTGMPGFDNLACARNEAIYVVDGNSYFNRPGPRLVDSLEILADLLHPAPGPRRGRNGAATASQGH